MDLGLKGKIIVISGAAGKEGSIGETILQRLAEEGAIPAVIDRNDRGFGYVEKIQEKGIDAIFCQTDVTDPVSYTHLRAHETDSYLVCRLLLEKKKKNKK